MIEISKNIVSSVFTSAAALLLSVSLTACSDSLGDMLGFGGIDAGDEVVFTTMVPDVPATRAAKEDWEKEVKAYNAVQEDYTFTISMFKEGVKEPEATGTYGPLSEVAEDGKVTYHGDGTLKLMDGSDRIYWKDNANKYGFMANTVSSTDIEEDQSDQQKWLYQDKLIGYSYLPVWNEKLGEPTDAFDKINYRTSKQWYADNKTAAEQSGLMVSNDDYKKIPLYMQHQRSWVTIILKAGEGVTREALAYATSDANIKATIYSYGGTEPTAITKAWSREELINYGSDKNGEAATGVSTTRYDAIVEPHNFIASKESQDNDIIARISVSNQNFTFAASNDMNYNNFIAVGGGTEEAKEAMKAYNLEPGKHLTITATLSRASRMIMITAWIEDWTETVTQTVCDDYGQNGDPILIENKEQLIDFLSQPAKNKAGNVGMIVPDNLTLDDWTGTYNLQATLNLAGSTLHVNSQFLNTIERTGSLVNGEVEVLDAFNGETAVASVNHGTIERVRVTTSSGELTPAKASKAGLVVTNYGTIYQCTSALPVYGSGDYVGGIAAKNLYDGEQGSIPVIESCTVSACVNGTNEVVAGGGIVGQAEGRVSNNTFEYGITLSQVGDRFQNIIASIGGKELTMHSNNSWPTTAEYKIHGTEVTITNNYPGQKYDAVINSQSELKTLLTSTYNKSNTIYRIASSFTVDRNADANNWIWGTDILNDEYFNSDASGTYASGNVRFKLNGNDRTITLTGTSNATMLFGSILGEVYDLNLLLKKPIVATRIITIDKDNKSVDTNTDAIAAFAYAVTGDGKISNITLKSADGSYIQSSTPAGIAVWAREGGTLTNCASNVQVKMELTSAGVDARHYAGGIVAVAHQATITQCKFYNSSTEAVTWASNMAKSSDRFCYGGIVGGTSENTLLHGDPLLTITDCSSWWTLPSFDETETNRPTMGSLIGTTRYHSTTDTSVHNAMADNNAGNWWVGTVGAGLRADGITELQAIGHKNSVTPAKPSGW